MFKPGDRIGDWIVEAALGEGGMGAVYRCHSVLSARVLAAVKVMKPMSVDDARERFVREVEAISGLRHESIIAVKGAGVDEARGLLYLSMELLQGQDLDVRLAVAPIPVDQAIDLASRFAEALAHAHGKGVVHRDIKPANFFLCDDGTARVVDFGIAVEEGRTRLTKTGMMPGTVSYMAPEALRGELVDARKGDIYALGLVVYEMLTGKVAFKASSELSDSGKIGMIVAQKLTATAQDPGPPFPAWLRELVKAATDPAPGTRVASMAAFAEALRTRQFEGPPRVDATFEVPIPAQPPPRPPPVQPVRHPIAPVADDPPRRRRGRSAGWIGAALFGAVLLLVGVGAGIAAVVVGGLMTLGAAPDDEALTGVFPDLPGGEDAVVWVRGEAGEIWLSHPGVPDSDVRIGTWPGAAGDHLASRVEELVNAEDRALVLTFPRGLEVGELEAVLNGARVRGIPRFYLHIDGAPAMGPVDFGASQSADPGKPPWGVLGTAVDLGLDLVRDGAQQGVVGTVAFAPLVAGPDGRTRVPPGREGAYTVDCSGAPADVRSACEGPTDAPDRVVVGDASGCLVPIADDPSGWGAQLERSLRGLKIAARDDVRISLRPAPTTTFAALYEVVAGVRGADPEGGLWLDLDGPGRAALPACGADVRDAAALELASAAWLGSLPRAAPAPAPGPAPVPAAALPEAPTREQFNRVVDGVREAIAAKCVTERGGAGVVVVVGPSGAVDSVRVEPENGCIRTVMSRLRLPASRSGGEFATKVATGRPTPAASTGTIQVRCSRRCLVSVDGKPVGYSPVDIDRPAGQYRIGAKVPLGSQQEQAVVLTAGAVRSVSFEL